MQNCLTNSNIYYSYYSMYIKYCLCEATGQIKWHQVIDVTNSRSIFVIHSNFFLYINAIMEVSTNLALYLVYRRTTNTCSLNNKEYDNSK